MADHEERMYRVAKTRPTLADIENQLTRLRNDLEQLRSRKGGGNLIAPLQARIRDLEATVEAAKARSRERRRQAEQAVPPEGETVRLTHERFASRRGR